MCFTVVSGLGTKNISDVCGDKDSQIYPWSLTKLNISLHSSGDSGNILDFLGTKSGIRLIAWSHCLCIGMHSDSSFLKTSKYAWNTGGTISCQLWHTHQHFRYIPVPVYRYCFLSQYLHHPFFYIIIHFFNRSFVFESFCLFLFMFSDCNCTLRNIW